LASFSASFSRAFSIFSIFSPTFPPNEQLHLVNPDWLYQNSEFAAKIWLKFGQTLEKFNKIGQISPNFAQFCPENCQ